MAGTEDAKSREGDKLGIAKEQKEATEASWEPGLREGESPERGDGWRQELSPCVARHGRAGSRSLAGFPPPPAPGGRALRDSRTRQGVWAGQRWWWLGLGGSGVGWLQMK